MCVCGPEQAQPHCPFRQRFVLQVASSQMVMDVLADVNARGRLFRVVVDECHCVSQARAHRHLGLSALQTAALMIRSSLV